MNPVRLYFRYIDFSFRAQMQYRVSFVLMTIGHFLGTGMEFLGILALFDRFDHIQGWTLHEVAVFYGLVNMAFSITDAVARGFDQIGTQIRSGDFDRLLLRPRSIALQLMGQELTLRRVGRFLQGAVVTVWALDHLELSWDMWKALLLFHTVLGGACFFFGLFVLQGTVTFWTTETLEIMNTVTYGGVETSQYPISIYRPWFQRFFIMVIPMACVTYFPILSILDRPDPLGTPVWFQTVAPAIGFAFLVVSLRIWRIGVRHYQSTGS